jgi:hypothetical protein
LAGGCRATASDSAEKSPPDINGGESHGMISGQSVLSHRRLSFVKTRGYLRSALLRCTQNPHLSHSFLIFGRKSFCNIDQIPVNAPFCVAK